MAKTEGNTPRDQAIKAFVTTAIGKDADGAFERLVKAADGTTPKTLRSDLLDLVFSDEE